MGAERARPWWASDDPGVDELFADEDPVTAHRTARRPAPADGEPDPAPADGDADPAPEREAPSAGGTHDPSTCGLCPVCIGLRLLGEHRPDVLNHLNEASRHLAAALRGLLEPTVDGSGEDRGSSHPPDRFERIEVVGPDEGGQPPPDAADGQQQDRGPGTGSA